MEYMYESCTTANRSAAFYSPSLFGRSILMVLVIVITLLVLCAWLLYTPPTLVEREAAPPNEYPFTGHLFIIKSDGTGGHCGGVLLSKKHVLTAAHCVEGATYVEVTLGLHDYNAFYEPTRQRYVCNIQQIKIHEGWNRSLAVNDLALIELPKMAKITDFVKTIALAPTGWENLSGQMATVVGWGYHPKSKNSALHYAHSQIIDNPYAQSIFSRHRWTFKIQDSHLPMLGVEKNATGPGDSGGPVIVNDELVGIISFQHGDGFKFKIPEVATKLTHHQVSSIKQNIGQIDIGDQWMSEQAMLRWTMTTLLFLLGLNHPGLFRPSNAMDWI